MLVIIQYYYVRLLFMSFVFTGVYLFYFVFLSKSSDPSVRRPNIGGIGAILLFFFILSFAKRVLFAVSQKNNTYGFLLLALRFL